MNFIHEPNGTVHFTLSPDLYVLNRVLNGYLYMTCATRQCQASICLRQNVVLRIKDHNHERNEDAVKATLFTKILRVRAIEENRRIIDIYNDLVNQYPEGGRCVTSVNSVKQHMGRARGFRPSVGYASLHNEPSGKVHCTFDSHIYRITKKYTSFCFARCVKAPKCPGRAVIHQGWFRESNPHNHPSSRRRMKRMLFLKSLKHRSASKNESLARSFHAESRKHPEGSAGVTFLSVRFQMKRARMIGEAAQPHVWYLPVDHTIFQKGSSKLRTVIVGTPRLPKTILHTGPTATNSFEISTKVTAGKGPVKIDWEKLPHPILTKSRRDKHALRAQFKKNVMKTCSELMDKVTCKTENNIHQYTTNRKQSQILPGASDLYENIDSYSSNRNQSQLLPPAQNLYFIMPPYYPPPTQKQELVSTGDNVDVEVKKSDVSEVDEGYCLNTSDIKIEIKEEVVDFGVLDDGVIDLSRESDVDDSILNEGDVKENPDSPKANIAIMNEIVGRDVDVPNLIRGSALIKNNTDVEDSMIKHSITLNMDVDDTIIVDQDVNPQAAGVDLTNANVSVISRRLSPIAIVDDKDANVSTQTDPLDSSDAVREDICRAHSDIVTETLMEMHKILKNLRSERNSSNEVFGKYVATSMGCMAKKNAQAARREILEVLDKYEM